MYNWAEIRKTYPAAAFVLTLLFSALAETQLVNLGKANPLPELYTRMTIENPKNTTYTTNTIVLNFSVESVSFFSRRNFSYSLDGQELKPIESISVVSQEFIPISPGVYNETLKGSCVLSNLSEGWHNVTVYLIRDSSTADPQYGEPLQLASTAFMIALPKVREPEPFPTTMVAVASGAIVALIATGLMVYFKKRNH